MLRWANLIRYGKSEYFYSACECPDRTSFAPRSFIIRNVLQWINSPVGTPGDRALAGYVVSPSFFLSQRTKVRL